MRTTSATDIVAFVTRADPNAQLPLTPVVLHILLTLTEEAAERAMRAIIDEAVSAVAEEFSEPS